MQMFVNSFQRQWGFRPLIQHLNYTAAWPLSIESTHCQQRGRNQYIQSLGSISSHSLLAWTLRRVKSHVLRDTIYTLKEKSKTPEYYLLQRSADATENGGHRLKTVTHSQATCQRCPKSRYGVVWYSRV